MLQRPLTSELGIHVMSARVAVRGPREPVSRVGPAVGIGISLLLHALVLGSVALGSGPAQRSHPPDGLGANAITSSEESVATLILIEDPAPGVHEDETVEERVTSRGPVLERFRLTIVSPIPTFNAAVDVDEDANETAAALEDSSGDRQKQAALYGLYLGQLQARVSRAWLRPRTPIGAESFDCRVRVVQNERGDVQEIALERCNGSTRWQLSLVHAIERASPLPAPPRPSVFSSSILMSFHAQAYVPGGDTELYEPEMPPALPGIARTTKEPSEGY